LALALAGFLLRTGRLDKGTTLDILLAAWDARGFPGENARREAHKDLEGVVKDTFAKLERGKPVVGGGRLEEATPGMTKQLCRYWGWESDLWDDPVPLPDGLPSVAAFDFALLPGPLREWIKDISERMQVPADFLATGAVVVAASLVGRKIGIYPKRFDDWLVVPNLWGAVVGPPATLKSPALAEVMKPLRRLEAEARQLYAVEVSDYEVGLTAHEAEQDALEAEMRKAAKESVMKGTGSL
jgi:Protein of unknown function (DUF3987)